MPDTGYFAFAPIDAGNAPRDYGIRRLREQIAFAATHVGFDSPARSISRLGFNEAPSFWSRLQRDHPYDVVEAGEDTLRVPLLGANCPDVPGASIKPSLTHSRAKTSTFNFKLYGTEVGKAVKATTEETIAFVCHPGECLKLYIEVPVRWEIRRVPHQSLLGPWLAVWPVPVAGRHPRHIGRGQPPTIGRPSRLGSYTLSAEKGIDSITDELKHEVTTSRTYSIGFLQQEFEAGITVVQESSVTMKFSYTLPSGQIYTVRCFEDPPFGHVTATPL